MMRNKDKIFKKWMPIFKKWMPIFKNAGISNEKLLELFCIYAENYANQNQSKVDLPEKISDLIWKLKSAKKLQVICTRYNPLSGKLEYELENGLVVDEDNKFNKELDQEELVSVFGVDFIREINKEEFREKRLNSIIDG